MASALAIAALACAATGVEVAQTPERLSNAEFHRLIDTLSEPAEPFFSINVVSNERSFAQVVPQLESSVAPGGVYVGVGPEQNFTYIAATKPHLAFVVDIQRSIFVEHLLYKALFDLSPTRAAFVERLFCRSLNANGSRSTALDLMSAASAAPADHAAFERNLEDVVDTLGTKYEIHVDASDRTSLREIYRLFATLGPKVDWSSTTTAPGTMAPYARLMAQHDIAGRELSFLQSEAAYARVADLERRNLLVPLVGNFAGPKTLRGIGDVLRARGDAVSVFYVSNVEEYLTRDRHLPIANGRWSDFCANVATWPLAPNAQFIRPYGLAEFDGLGTLLLNHDMTSVDNRRATTYRSGELHALPPALFPIASEVQACR